MKSERHIDGLKFIREKLKSGETIHKTQKPKKIEKEEIIEIKNEEDVKVEEPQISDQKLEIIKDNIKKLLTHEEEDIKIPKVSIYLT
jgi:hypothetical protein